MVVPVLISLCVMTGMARTTAGSVTVSTSNAGRNVQRIDLAWTSDSSGAVSGHAFSLSAGYIISVQFAPGGIAAPSDQYDVTLIDSTGLDILHGHGADQSSTVTDRYSMDPEWFNDSSHTVDLVITNAGNAKSGTVTVWVQ